jgi:hypothetical protein
MTADLAQAVSNAKDAKKTYEQLLDSSIQNSQKKYQKFPMQLFGITITYAVLAGYIAFALAPLVQQAKHAGPGIAKHVCHAVESSSIMVLIDDKILEATRTVNDAAREVGSQVDSAVGGETGLSKPVVPEVSVREMFHEAVCKPLVKSMVSNLDAGVAKIKAAEKATESGRRLSKTVRAANVSVEEIVAEWWEAHPGDPELRLDQVEHVLLEMAARASRLGTAPAIVARAYASAGLEAALDTATLFLESEEPTNRVVV